jgi:hypothetical protein
MSSTQHTAQESPYPRDNYWGEVSDNSDSDESESPGHDEPAGTDAAEYLMFRELSELESLICGRSLNTLDQKTELSDPELYVPKTVDLGTRSLEYGQHRHRRRINEETGWINWGETTWTDVPEVDGQTYMQAVHNYLWRNGVQVTNIEDWLAYARRLFNDQQLNSKEALATFIRKKRAYDQREIYQIPDA